MLIGLLFHEILFSNKSYAGFGGSKSNATMKWEYLQQGDSLGIGFFYRCKLPTGWLVIHTEGTQNPVFVSDVNHDWK